MTTPTMTAIARIQDLTKTYGAGAAKVTALDGVTLEFQHGGFTAIMGPSGSGKSTLMHLMAGLDAPTSGRVWLGDREISALGDEDLTILRRRSIGFVFQAFNLVPTLDVESNILLPLVLDGCRIGPKERVLVDQLAAALGLSDRLTHRPGELSGGEQQRVALARALVTDPDIVIADEPTGNLDLRTGRDVLQLLAEAGRERGQSIVMVTHDPIAAAYADRVVYLADGRLVRDAPAEPAEQIASYMLSIEALA